MFDEIKPEKNILIVDDAPTTRQFLVSFLKQYYAQVEEAGSAEAALQKIHEKRYAVILSDIVLPKLSGVEMIPYIKNVSPHSVIVLFSGKLSAEYAVSALRAGAFDYLTKPFEAEQILAVVQRAAEHYELKCLKENYQAHLEELVARRTAELDKVVEEVENSYRVTLKALVQALETRDVETHGHSERVVTFSLRLGYELGLDKNALRNLELGALLHDIGKIGVPDAVLRKPSKLTDEEWHKMRLHPIYGQRILRSIPFLEGAARVVAQHHERWDGTGYPLKLRGEEIDLAARIFAVADAFDAMISHRVYRRGRSFKDALRELERCAGTQFDPQIVEAFKNVPGEDWEILRERSLKDRAEISSFQAVVAELVYSKHQLEFVH
ncbi:MAG TPA: HD domain-containing phosphohydrolase [Pyrinomonadaceae bacterium]|nr:HD domain-containing phosphohydrolase [Pyrinomonadaceae bacterium]